MITLTPNAARKIKVLAAKQGKGPLLRVKVVPGGCSGLSYSFELGGETGPEDMVAELEGARAAVDPNSHPFVAGSTVDYVETLMKSGFEVTNPKATSSCSCGASFNTEDTEPKDETFAV